MIAWIALGIALVDLAVIVAAVVGGALVGRKAAPYVQSARGMVDLLGVTVPVDSQGTPPPRS